MMVASLTYTPVFDAGLEKLGRFLSVTGIVIVAPFFVLGTASAMKRFLIGFGCVAFVICAYSLHVAWRLGPPRHAEQQHHRPRPHRLRLILLIWFALMPRLPFPKRMLFYPLLAVPARVAGRFGIARRRYRARRHDRGQPLLLPPPTRRPCLPRRALCSRYYRSCTFPDASFEYLGTLASSQSLKSPALFSGRLLDYGWTLLRSIR